MFILSFGVRQMKFHHCCPTCYGQVWS